MTLKTYKDYAKENNVTYETVRKQVKRYWPQIKEFIVKEGRTHYLTEEAIKFLDEKRESNPVIVQQVEKNEEIERLQAENKVLLIKIAELQDQLIESQRQTFKEIEKHRLLESENKHEDQLQEQIEHIEQKLQHLEEIQNTKKGFFTGLINSIKNWQQKRQTTAG